ncbi:MAG: ABC transporter ATP-binding protein [Actinomycetota bacterium]|nr:ABC transporter ATP-binding protein [Actinomycetota bacterium]
MAVDNAIVELKNVARAFGSVVGVADLSLSVPASAVTVLLGPNGAGKTTALRLITGALPSESGTAAVFGLDPVREGEEVRRRCGVVSAQPALYNRLSGRDNLRYAAHLYGVGENGPLEESAARFGIKDALDLKVGGYSTGMKTRLALARAVLHDPDLLLLDEPTSGLDPESARAVLELIDQTAADGKTVVMCTHLLPEAEGLADQVVILENGRDVVTGPPSELVRRYWPHPVVTLDAEDPLGLKEAEGLEGVLHVDLDTSAGDADVAVDTLERVPDIVAELSRRGIRLTRVAPHHATLEELYFAVRKESQEAG